jgi:ankyrin repeat protein
MLARMSVPADPQRMFEEAILTGDRDIVEQLLGDHCTPTMPVYGGCTPLALAAMEGHVSIVELLLARGADLHADESSALRRAAACGQWPVVSQLLAAGANPRVDDFSPFRLACRSGCERSARALASAAPPPQSVVAEELRAAVAVLDHNIVRTLLDWYDSPRLLGDDLLAEVSRTGDLQMARLLVSREMRPRLEHLRIALRHGHSRLVRLYGKSGANLHEDNECLLCEAAAQARLGLVWYLLSHGADVEAGEGRPLLEAVRGGSLDTVRMLIDHGADVSAGAYAAVREAAALGRREIFNTLLGAVQEATNPFEARRLRDLYGEALEGETPPQLRDRHRQVAELAAAGRISDLANLLGQPEFRTIEPIGAVLAESVRLGQWQVVQVLIKYGGELLGDLVPLARAAAAQAGPATLAQLVDRLPASEACSPALLQAALLAGNRANARWLLDYYREAGGLEALDAALRLMGAADPFKV